MGFQPQGVEPLSSVPIGRPRIPCPERQAVPGQTVGLPGEVMPSGSKVPFRMVVRVVTIESKGTTVQAEEEK